MSLGDGVDHLGGGDTASGGHFPGASLDEVVVYESQDEVRLNPGAVGVDDAEAIGVTVGGDPPKRSSRSKKAPAPGQGSLL